MDICRLPLLFSLLISLLVSCTKTTNKRSIASNSEKSCINIINTLTQRDVDVGKQVAFKYFSKSNESWLHTHGTIISQNISEQTVEFRKLNGELITVEIPNIQTDYIHNVNVDEHGVVTRIDYYPKNPVTITELTGIPDKEKIPLDKIFNDNIDPKNRVVLGIKDEHVYLIVGDTRIDGNILKTIRPKRKTQMAEKGLLINFNDLPEESINKMKAYLNKSKKLSSISCIGLTCKVLQEGGVHIKGAKATPVSKLKNIFQQGFVDKNGNPISYTIYSANSNIQMRDTMNSFKYMQYYSTAILVNGLGWTTFMIIMLQIQ